MGVLTIDWINKTVNRLRNDNREDFRIVLIELMELLDGDKEEVDQKGNKAAGSIPSESKKSENVNRRVRKQSAKKEVKSEHADKASSGAGEDFNEDEKEKE